MKKYIQPHSYVVEIATTNNVLGLVAASTEGMSVDTNKTTTNALSDEIDVGSGSEEGWSD